MKKLTELDLQNALDECELIRFSTHGDWLAGMVKRLNAALGFISEEKKLVKGYSESAKRTVIKIGDLSDPEVPCKS